MQYNTAGAVVAILDPLSHGVTISYADSFSDDNNSRNTLAYPTTVTDPDGYSASVRYNYDFGAATWKQTPLPNVTDNQPGPQQVISFDSIGRLDRVTSLVNNAYTRYIYGPNYVETFATVNTVADEAHSLQVFDGHGRVIAKASNHPGSVGGFSGQLFIYDQMGQMVKTSNPTETSITISNPPMSLQPYSWAAAGDDAQAGWVYTQQTYDWKGRPLMTTNPSTTGNPADSTTKSAGYSGCGCAGGDVVTLTDEGTIDGGVAKRRQKKIYSDVLGRTVKTEVLNWEGGSVYSTTLNTYNARDQITLIRQFQGTAPSDLNDLSCPSGTCQKTTMAFDGYGRLQTKHVPEQQVDPNNSSSTDHTTYSYNNDDKVYTATDARGAVTTYGYNNRQLVKSVSHALSAHSTINVSYNYDAAGNRTSMSHTVAGAAQDSASYSYDQLSRLMSETRHLDALTGYSMGGNYTIGYGYTLSGELQSITDPFDSTINYSYDAVGRTSTVTGSAYGGVTSYASNVQYRAWGAVKAADFGDGQSESVPQFNARMRPTQFRTGNSQNSGYRYDYSYYDDGRLSQVRDLDDKVGDPRTVQFHYMSRVYAYDQAARIGGVTAMNPNPNGNAIPAPFTGNYGYDAFSNLTSRSGHYALNSDQSDSATYTNNRRVQTGWSYDADGRILTSTDNSDVAGSSARSWSYDAAGEEISVAQTAAGVTATDTMTYDGDGQLIYESVANQSTATTAYLIHSTVLESVLTKLDATGNKNTTYVPANGLVSPLQQKDNQGNPTMYWVHRDALGVQENGAAYDPFGALISNVQPPVFTPPPNQPFYGPSYSGSGSSSFTNANNFSVGCQMDGIAASCATVLRAIDHGWPGTVIISTTGGMAELANLGIFVSVSPAQPSNSGPPTLKPSTMKENPERNRNPYGIGDDEGLQYVINISFSSDLLDGDPQNSDFVPLPNLRKGIDALARLGDCGQYIQSLINKVAEGTGNPFVSDYITDLFDTISSQGGVAFRQADPARSETGGTVSGMIKGGDATIIITPQPSGEGSATARTLTPYGLRSTVYLYFIAAIHESIHLAGLNRRYSDRQLAEAAHALNDKSYLPNDPRNVSANSDAWNSELMKHCPGPKE